MSKQNTSSKGFAPWRWLKRMFFGASKEYTLADERYDSPGKLAVKRFFRNPLAVIALTILVGMFLFVFIGPIFAPVDLTETGSEMLHVNVRPTMSLMKLPDELIDYVIIHELCHTIHKNHGPKFHKLLDCLTGGHHLELRRRLKTYSTRW